MRWEEQGAGVYRRPQWMGMLPTGRSHRPRYFNNRARGRKCFDHIKRQVFRSGLGENVKIGNLGRADHCNLARKTMEVSRSVSSTFLRKIGGRSTAIMVPCLSRLG